MLLVQKELFFKKVSMIIVVDAYNLLRAIPPYKKTITDKERVQFIVRLSTYGRSKGHKMIIVFDGGPYEWPSKESKKGVQIVYSGIHETADDYIKKYMSENRSKDLLLVSSDGELNRYAAQLTIPSIDSPVFYQLVSEVTFSKQSSQTLSQKGLVIKSTENSEDYVDELMKEASKSVPAKSEDFIYDKNRRKTSEHVSKDERALLKKLKKL
jgi:predicted RNA-binding protein with PIN domain